MQRRSRLRRVLKWLGTVMCLLLIAASVLSALEGVYFLWIPHSSSSTSWVIHSRLSSGRLMFDVSHGPHYPAKWSWGSLSMRSRWVSRWTWWCRPFYYKVQGGSRSLTIIIPLWIPVLATLIPTALLWYRDRPPPGHCRKCGYDLTGNESGVCPECGTELTMGQRRRSETRAGFDRR